MIPYTKKGGNAMVSMQDIADKAGVSRVTVSRVLSNHPSVKAETRQKILHWVKELDYEPNLIAQLRQRKVDGVIAVPVSAEQSLPAYTTSPPVKPSPLSGNWDTQFHRTLPGNPRSASCPPRSNE